MSNIINSTQEMLSGSKNLLNISMDVAVEVEVKNSIVATRITNANANVDLTVNTTAEINKIG